MLKTNQWQQNQSLQSQQRICAHNQQYFLWWWTQKHIFVSPHPSVTKQIRINRLYLLRNSEEDERMQENWWEYAKIGKG